MKTFQNMEELLKNFSESESELTSAAARITKFFFADESQFNAFVELFVNCAKKEPSSSLKFAKLAKKLENFSISFKTSEKPIFFLYKLFIFLRSKNQKSSNKNCAVPTETFVENLFLADVSFLKDMLISDIEDNDETTNSDFRPPHEEEEEEEGAWNMQTINETQESSTQLKENLRGDFKKFLCDKTSDGQMFECSDSEKLSWAQKLLEASKADVGNAKFYAEIVKNIKFKTSEETVKDLAKYVKKVVKKEMRVIFATVTIDWNDVVMAGTFVGELYNAEVVLNTFVTTWINKILSNSTNSIKAAITFLLIFKRIGKKLKENDKNTYNKFMSFVENIRDGKKIVIAVEPETMEVSNISAISNEELPFNPEKVQAFRDHIEAQTDLDINIVELLKVSSEGDRRKFVEIVIENAKAKTENISFLSHFCSKMLRLRIAMRTVANNVRHEFKLRLCADTQAMTEKKFWQKTNLHGKFIEKLLEDFFFFKDCMEFVDLWLESIFKHSNIDEKLALKTFKSSPNLTVDELKRKIPNDSNFCENFTKLMRKLFEQFPWLKKCDKSYDYNELSIDINAKPQRRINERSTITKNFQQYMHALKSVNHQNVFFDMTSFDSPKVETFPSGFVDYTLQNIEFAKGYAHFTEEIRNVRFKTKYFLKELNQRFDHEVEFNLFKQQTDWSRMINFGVFLCKLYKLEVVNLRTFNSWMDKVCFLVNSSSESENALKLFVSAFKYVGNSMKGCDLTSFQKYLNMVVEINERTDIQEENKILVIKIMEKFKMNILKKAPVAAKNSKILLKLVSQIKTGKTFGTYLKSLEAKELAKSFFLEVNANSGSIETLVSAVNAIANSEESSKTDFLQAMKDLCANHFDLSASDRSDNTSLESFQASVFIGELYNTDFLDEKFMQNILMNLSKDILKNSILFVRFEAIIPTIKEKARNNFEENKHRTTSSPVHELIEKFERKFGEIFVQNQLLQKVFRFPPSNGPSKDNFTEMIKKVLGNQMTAEDYKTVLSFDLKTFIEFFVKCAVKNPKWSAVFASKTREISAFQANNAETSGATVDKTSFKKRLITETQQNFEILLTEEAEKSKMIGVCKFLGELFNENILTSKIIASCLQMLSESCFESSKESSEILLETITRKVINDQDKYHLLFPSVRNLVLKRSFMNK